MGAGVGMLEIVLPGTTDIAIDIDVIGLFTVVTGPGPPPGVDSGDEPTGFDIDGFGDVGSIAVALADTAGQMPNANWQRPPQYVSPVPQ